MYLQKLLIYWSPEKNNFGGKDKFWREKCNKSKWKCQGLLGTRVKTNFGGQDLISARRPVRIFVSIKSKWTNTLKNFCRLLKFFIYGELTVFFNKYICTYVYIYLWIHLPISIRAAFQYTLPMYTGSAWQPIVHITHDQGGQMSLWKYRPKSYPNFLLLNVGTYVHSLFSRKKLLKFGLRWQIYKNSPK
jgi:hypothetical protein